jgi:glycosyltransferase involved in cell wall biosynthesis
LNLVIVHYHFRPGGIRRIIELATPHLVAQFRGRIRKVILAGGEASDPHWNRSFQKQLPSLEVEFFLERAFHYLSDQNEGGVELTAKLRESMGRLFEESHGENAIVWAHNLGIARNLLLARELVRACSARKIPLVAHHHDWWFDNRWLRWPEMRRFGIPTISAAARVIFPPVPEIRHVAINHADAKILERHFSRRAGWLPNLSEPEPPPSAERIEAAKVWLGRKLQDRNAPVWLVPCRLLRRKNIAEALLLTRWLHPGAWLVTTGAPSSSDELNYAATLAKAARKHHWPLQLSLLEGNEAHKPSVRELMAASEAVLLTSIQEGFGLPYLEAAAAGRPLIARSIPKIVPDLEQFGFRFPQMYQEILVPPELIDWDAETERQTKSFFSWKAVLPSSCRPWAGTPWLLARKGKPQPVPFSRLTLTAQLEALAHPPELSWEAASVLNPLLVHWKKLAAKERLRITPWPKAASEWLSGQAYGRQFENILRKNGGPTPPAEKAMAAQQDFIREKMGAPNLFPLLWTR